MMHGAGMGMEAGLAVGCQLLLLTLFLVSSQAVGEAKVG